MSGYEEEYATNHSEPHNLKMNCPHCQKELPQNYSAAFCPFCGEAIEAKGEAPASSENPPRKRFFWGWWFLVVAIPAIVNFLLTAIFSNSDQAANLMVLATFGGSPVAGLVSAILMVRWERNDYGSASITKVILVSILFSVISFGLCFVGCAAGFSLAK
jgi:hypothetical protein